MNGKHNEVVSSKVATLSAADLIPRTSTGRSPARFSPRSKKSSILDLKRTSRSPKRQLGFSSPRKKNRFQLSFASSSKKSALRSPNRIQSESSPNHDVQNPCSVKLDLTNNDHSNSMEHTSEDENRQISSGPECTTHYSGLSHLECSVLCVDIDATRGALTMTEETEKKDVVPTNNDAELEPSDSDSKDDGTSSWHPSDDDASSLGDSERLRLRRKRSGSDAKNGPVQRSQRKRRRVYWQSDSSGASSPSVETRRTKRTKQLSSVVDGMTSTLNNNTVPESDDYCWICHKVGQMVICGCCPRVYHPACLCMKQFPDTWLCPECQDLLVAECMLYQLPGWKDITTNQLQDMLLFLIDRLAMQQWAEHFREPVDPNVIEGYTDIVSYPMDLHTLYQRILDGVYASTQAFLSDFRWILHNCIIFNGSSSPLTSCARTLDRTCTLELALMRACPLCYIRRMSAIHMLPMTTTTLPPLTKSEWHRSTDFAHKSDSADSSQSTSNLDPWWFCHLCDVLHPIVWVRLQRYPRWPAKVMALDADNLLVSFFGDYDLTMAPIGSAQLHSDSRVVRSYYAHSAANTTAESSRLSNPLAPIPSPGMPTPPLSPTSNTLAVPGGGSGGSNNSRATKSSSDPTVDVNYKRALAELDCHMVKIRERYPDFKLPATQLEFTKRFYLRFQKSYGSGSNSKSMKQSVQPMSVDAPVSQSKAVSVVGECGTSVTKSTENRDCVEPVLSRVASGLLTTTDPTKLDSTMSTKCSENTSANASSDPGPHSSTVRQLPTEGSLEMIPCNDYPPKPKTSHQEAEVDNTEPPLSKLHPIPQMSPHGADSTDEVCMLLERMRSQFNETLHSLEEKLQSSRAANEQKYSLAHEPPTLSALTMETEVQTESHLPPLKRHKSNRSVSSITVKPELVEVSTTTKHSSSSAMLSPLQAVLMEGEITRLERENQRLNLLLAFTRAELAFEMRHRIAELRRVWNFEVTAILEAASTIWEQDVIRIVDAVKRKQWCAYCGRVAFYYCCWNTCYCNSVCQAKHWASHITSCVQAKSQQFVVDSHSPTPAKGAAISTSTDKFERNHQQQTIVHWPPLPGHSAPNSSTSSTIVSTNRGQNIQMRGRMKP